MTKIITYAFCAILLFGGLSFAESPESIYRAGNTAYESKDYEKSASSYETLVKIGKVSPEVFYNLGNSYFKLKKTGRAILNYERALRLAPRDRGTRLNLKLAKTMVVDKIDSPERGFMLDAILFLYDRMNINELTVMVSLLYFIVIFLMALLLFFIEKRRVIFYSAGTVSVVLLISAIFLVSKIYNENTVKSGVITAEKVEVRSGPKEDYLLQFTLHEGAEVRIVEERQNWYEISLSSALRGWLPKDSVGII